MIYLSYEDKIRELDYPDNGMPAEAFRTKLNKYRLAENAIEQEFKEALFKEYLPNCSIKKKELLWQKCWEYGHSNGYGEVENYFMELAELIR